MFNPGKFYKRAGPNYENIMPNGKHRGTCISLWVSDEEYEKIEALKASSGLSRSDLIKKLLAGEPLPDKSYWKTYKQIASIGGMIKKFMENGTYGNAYKLGCDILATARELERLDKERQKQPRI